MPKNEGKTEPGLYLLGEVMARKRREVKTAAGAARFLIRLFVRTNAGVTQADRCADSPLPDGTPDVGGVGDAPGRGDGLHEPRSGGQPPHLGRRRGRK